MRILFGVLSLLVVLAVVGLTTRTQSLPGAAAPSGVASAGGAPAASAAAQQIQQKIKDDLNKLMQAQPDRGEPTQ